MEGVYHASLWGGSSGSWVDLHPAGFQSSQAAAVYGNRQGGNATISGITFHAGVWSGTADSWIDLHPSAAEASILVAMDDVQQVGYARLNGAIHAGLWSGSASSWVDLHPVGATQSSAHALFDGMQVGYADFGNILSRRAGLWSGSRDTWLDLSAFLPSDLIRSEARGIASDGQNLYITGYAINSTTGREEAVLWVRPIPAPSVAMALGLGGLLASRRGRRDDRA